MVNELNDIMLMRDVDNEKLFLLTEFHQQLTMTPQDMFEEVFKLDSRGSLIGLCY